MWARTLVGAPKTESQVLHVPTEGLVGDVESLSPESREVQFLPTLAKLSARETEFS